jgi:hypothetical protein
VTHAGTRYLLFTDWRDPEDFSTVAQPRTIVQYATSASLSVDSLGSANWQYRGYTPDPGVNAIEELLVGGAEIVSQSISNPDCPDHAKHRRDLRLRHLNWLADGSFTTENWVRGPCTQALVSRPPRTPTAP